jgi:hypothetical protein
MQAAIVNKLGALFALKAKAAKHGHEVGKAYSLTSIQKTRRKSSAPYQSRIWGKTLHTNPYTM